MVDNVNLNISPIDSGKEVRVNKVIHNSKDKQRRPFSRQFKMEVDDETDSHERPGDENRDQGFEEDNVQILHKDTDMSSRDTDLEKAPPEKPKIVIDVVV